MVVGGVINVANDKFVLGICNFNNNTSHTFE
jgi:hypothetical protein